MALHDSWHGLSLSATSGAAQGLPSLSLRSHAKRGWPQWSLSSHMPTQPRTQGRMHWHWLGLLLVGLVHVLLLGWMMAGNEPPMVTIIEPPMTVSLITPASQNRAPAPEVVPVIHPKVQKNSVVKPQLKQVQTTHAAPMPAVERVQENAADTPQFEARAQASAPPVIASAASTPTSVAPASAVQTKPEPDEKEEPPKFGVAYLNNPAPEYPRMSKRAGEQGRVLVKVLVNADGSPGGVELAKSSGFERLDNAALTAVRQWRFEPARKGGKAISAYIFVPLPFSLN